MKIVEDMDLFLKDPDPVMYIPRDWNDRPNPVPSGLLFSHDFSFQRLEKALLDSQESLDEIHKQGFDCLASRDFHGRQYFQMMMSL